MEDTLKAILKELVAIRRLLLGEIAARAREQAQSEEPKKPLLFGMDKDAG